MSGIAARAGADDVVPSLARTLARLGSTDDGSSRAVLRTGHGLQFWTLAGSALDPRRLDDRDRHSLVAIASAPTIERPIPEASEAPGGASEGSRSVSTATGRPPADWSATEMGRVDQSAADVLPPDQSARNGAPSPLSDGSTSSTDADPRGGGSAGAPDAGPRTSRSGDVALVLEGSVENADERCEEVAEGELELGGSDATLVAHLIEQRVDAGSTPGAAVRDAVDELDGEFAVLAVTTTREAVFAASTGPALVLGVDDTGHVLAADEAAIRPEADAILRLRAGDAAVVTPSTYAVTDLAGDLVVRSPELVERGPRQADGDGTSPRRPAGRGARTDGPLRPESSLARSLDGRLDADRGTVQLATVPPGAFADVDRVRLIGSGASYHAGTYGTRLVAERGLPAVAQRAREFSTAAVDDGTLVVGVGGPEETGHLRRSLRRAADAGALTLAVTDGTDGSVARIAEYVVPAGDDSGRALPTSTAFCTQVATLGLLSVRLARDVPDADGDRVEELVASLEHLPSALVEALANSPSRDAMRHTAPAESFVLVGQGVAAPAARVGADVLARAGTVLTQGVTAGRLARGHLDRIPPDSTLVALFTGSTDDATLDDVHEARNRGTPVVAVAPASATSAIAAADATLQIPETDPALAGLVATVRVQHLARRIESFLDRPVDGSDDRGASVTVE